MGLALHHLHQGLSPRVRGNRDHKAEPVPCTGSIPACAGEPRSPNRARQGNKVYPRVCGGTVVFEATPLPEPGLSPRVRGNHRANCYFAIFPGSIPSCAGEPLVVKLLILLPLQIKL